MSIACLVLDAGVFKGKGNCSVDSAHIVVDDVAHAVQAAFHCTRLQRFHAMR